jgi:hypothetical protein
MLLFASFIAAAIGDMWRTRRQLRDYPQLSEVAGQCLILQVALSVYVIPNFFINRQNLDLMYHLVGLSVALSAVAKYKMSEIQVEESASGEFLIIAEPVMA